MSRYEKCVRIVVLLGDMRKHQIARDGVETFRVTEIFAYGVIREMPGSAENALLDDPWIRADLEHFEIMVGFENKAVRPAQMNFDMIWNVAEIGADGDLGAVGTEGESDGVGSVVRDGERVHLDIADRKTLAGLDRLNAAEALAEGFGQAALQGFHRGLSDVERGFPEAEDLREAVAVVGVLVGDEDRIEAIDVAFDGGEASEGFAFTEAGVNEDSGGVRFEQG